MYKNMNRFVHDTSKKIFKKKKWNLCHENESPLGHSIKMLKRIKHFYSFTCASFLGVWKSSWCPNGKRSCVHYSLAQFWLKLTSLIPIRFDCLPISNPSLKWQLIAVSMWLPCAELRSSSFFHHQELAFQSNLRWEAWPVIHLWKRDGFRLNFIFTSCSL